MAVLVRHLSAPQNLVCTAACKQVDLHIRDAGFVGILAAILIGILPHEIADLTGAGANWSAIEVKVSCPTNLRTASNTKGGICRLVKHDPTKPTRSAGVNILPARAVADLEEVHDRDELENRTGVISGTGQGGGTYILIEMPRCRVHEATLRRITTALEFKQWPIAAGQVWIGRATSPSDIDVKPVARVERALQMAG